MKEARQIESVVVKQFYMKGKYCDVQLQVDNVLFKCHRSLLGAISEYFDAMFGHDFKVSNTMSDKPITLHGLDATAFEKILHFIYTGNLCINASDIYQLLFMSDFLGLRTAHIREQCIKNLRFLSQFEPKPISNALDLFSFASMKADDTVLIDILTTYICKHLYHYSKEEKLMKIPFKHLNMLLKFSKNYILSLPGSQNVLLKIIYNWVNHNREKRWTYRCELMKNVNFSNVSSDFMSLLIKELDNFADAVLGLPKNTEKTLKIGMVNDLTVGDAWFEGTILFDVKNLSEMKFDGKNIYSSPCLISNLLWKISVKRFNADLGVHLYCDGPNESFQQGWKCCAGVTFTLVSHKKGKSDLIIGSGSYIFSYKYAGWGYEFTSWNDLIDAENGYYIKDGDYITLRAHVHADVPFYSPGY